MTNELRHTDCDCCEHAQAIIDRLRTSLALKDKALEPFVNLLKAYEEDDPLFSHVENHYVIYGIDREDNQDDVVITVGDLRRASQALALTVEK